MTRRVTLGHMAKKRRTFTPTYIRQWRLKRDLTLEQVKERLLQHDISITRTSLSRIELGKQPYSQPILEALARILETDPGSLLMRDPAHTDAMWALRVLSDLADEKKKASGE